MRIFLALLLLPVALRAEEKPIPQAWEYAAAMKKVAAKFDGKPGVVLHVGDSITYANPYSAWAKGGEGKTEADKAVLKWMHAGEKNTLDGWHLASFDHPDGGRSYTACSGIRVDELLAGGKQKMPSLDQLLGQYSPQAVVLMIGTNDASGDRRPREFIADVTAAVDLILAKNAVPILSTIPPHVNKFVTGQEYNAAIRTLAKEKSLPLIDFEKEILARRPDDWNGTLMSQGDVHPRAELGGTKANSEPTAENLKNSGYLLRGWLSVKKIGEVKTTVFDTLTSKGNPVAVPEGTPVKLPVNRDTWISSVAGEEDGSNGGAGKLKLKSYQEFSIVDFDPAPLKGKKINAAFLHVKLAGPERLRRVGISSLSADWVEGQGTGYAKEAGASTFRHRLHPETPWAYPGSDICAVMFSKGGSLWGNADASEPDADGWQTIRVDLNVIRARIVGASSGFVLFDDTGSEWTRDGEKVTFRPFPNRFIHSRESGPKNAPWFEVYVGNDDRGTPHTALSLTPLADIYTLGDGEQGLIVSSDGVGNQSSFLAYDMTANGKPVPRHLLPGPAVDQRFSPSFHLRDMGFAAGEKVKFVVTITDGAGNRSKPAEFTIEMAGHARTGIPKADVSYPTAVGALPTLAGTPVAIIDELDKVEPTTGQLIPPQPEAYWAANHLWNAKDNLISLHAAKGEIIAFQVAFRGGVKNAKPTLVMPTLPTSSVSFGQYQSVEAKTGPLPDPITPVFDTFSVPFSDLRPKEVNGSLHVEMLIPKEAKPGEHRGTLTLAVGGEKLEIPIHLTVWNFSLPDRLSFLPDMNAYGLPADEHGYYRLAHRHRTVLNVVPYSQRGNVTDGWAPTITEGKLDFREWDARFGPYFDGTAFKDLPRAGTPMECFYLPLHENWPLPIDEHYNGSYWADQAFTKQYRAAFVDASRQFADHIRDKKWKDTRFQCFLNNKVEFKKNGWSRATSPWLLDEPASFQDFWALKFFADAFHEGRKAGGGTPPPNVVFRADISRPMWQRDTLAGKLGYNVVNTDWRRYRRMVLDWQDGLLIEYASANDIETSNLQAVAWSVDAWTLGANGVLPWLAVGTAEAWQKAEATSLFYPPRKGEKEPTPSVRLKAFRRGQQDVEYFYSLANAMKQPVEDLRQKIRAELPLTVKKSGTGAAGEDAGVLTYAGLKPQDLWALRVRVGKVIDGLMTKK